MNLQLTADERAFRDEVRAFLGEHLGDELTRGQRLTTTVLTEPEVSARWHRALYQRGWAAPSWPPEHGGPGWSPVQHFLFEWECERAGAPKVSIIGLRMVGPVLIAFGTPEQQRRYLPGILSGDDYWCQGYSEPGAGSDLAALQTRAAREGDDYVVNGTKIWTTHAHLANRMFALVRTGGEGGRKQDGISFLLIDMDTPGITVQPIRTIGGEHEVNQVFFDDVRVPQANRVGEEGKGWSYGKVLLEFERGGGAVAARLRAALTRVRAVMEPTAPDGRSPMDDDPSLRSRVARLEIDLDALAMTELRLMAARQQGHAPGPMSSLLKLRSSELQQAIGRLGVDAVGHDVLPWEPRRPLYGIDPPAFIDEAAMPIASLYLNARAYSIFGGSIEVQHDILAKTLLA